MNPEKSFYINLVEFLGKVLGPRYEIVYHVISKRGSYIAAICNNHISGRTVESPLTAFANQLIQDKVYLQKDFIHGYKAAIAGNRVITGSTFFIKNKDNEIAGLFCINYDDTEIRETLNKLIHLENLNVFFELKNEESHIIHQSKKEHADGILENLNQSIDELVTEAIGISHGIYHLTPSQKQNCIEKIFANGIFNIKGAISVVSRRLNMSEPSIYRYLQRIKKNKNT